MIFGPRESRVRLFRGVAGSAAGAGAASGPAAATVSGAPPSPAMIRSKRAR